MKTKKYLQITLMLLLPFALKAQWSPVRFDHFNMFEKIVAVDEDNVFFIARDYMNYRNFFMRTNDGGTTWDSVGIYPVATDNELRTIFFVNTIVGFIGGSKNNKQVLLKTLDGGNTWADITPDTTQNIMSIHFMDALNGIVTDSWDNLYFTTDGGTTWASSAITHNISDLYFIDNNTGFASGGTASTSSAIISKTTDGGQNWTPLLTVANPNLFVSSFDKMDFVSPNEGFVWMGNTNQIYKTLDGGNSWDTITVAAVQYIADFDFTSVNNGHILSLAGELFVTTDGGQTWTLEYATTWGAYGPSVFLYSIAFVNGTGYVGGSNGLVKKHVDITGIEKIEPTNSIRLYPNPLTSSSLTIELLEPIKNGSISIANALGQTVFQQVVKNVSNTIILSDVNLPKGMYYLEIETEHTKAVQKLVVSE